MKWEKTCKRPVKTVFVNGEWHMELDEKGFYISNFEILLSPVGIGATEQEAFASMLSNIARYEQKLKKIRIEIQNHLNELKGEK